ncbi:hypothetical protein HMPREF2532_02835 [Bacteroides ovatus]|nr:hypothetical protein HMPREF2532_02835 [Bacteroides ovatus]CAG9868460.1 hypothetical protein BOVAC1_2815 [Bacteroides ovatus]CAG9915526.1 hypothetical protein BOVA208_374 [Bacteroides ovatus]
MVVGCALRGLFFCIYVPDDGIMIIGMDKEKWIITQSGHYPFYNFLLKVTSTIN